MTILLVIIYVLMVLFTYGMVYNNNLEKEYIIKSVLWPIVYIVRAIKIILFLAHELTASGLTIIGYNYTKTLRYKKIQNYLIK